jgi:hypothetical protein
MVLSIEKVLNGKYPPATRPYSQLELDEIRTRNLRRLSIGNQMACHECRHIYFAKENGKKEERIKSGEGDIGQCSVCWKLKRTPVELRDRAQDLVDEYLYHYTDKPSKWSHFIIHVEQTYYRWLYLNFEECQTNDNRYDRRRNDHRQGGGGRNEYRNDRRNEYRNDRRDNRRRNSSNEGKVVEEKAPNFTSTTDFPGLQ